jgi:hypothetical protein
VVEAGALRIERNGLVEIGDRPLAVALVSEYDAAVVVGGGVVGRKPDRSVEVGDSAIAVATAAVGQAAAQIGRDELGSSWIA